MRGTKKGTGGADSPYDPKENWPHQAQRWEKLLPRGTNTTVVDFALLRFAANDSTNFSITERW